VRKSLIEHLPNGAFAAVPVARSKCMSAIRGRRNKTTELALRMALVRNHISGFKLHASTLFGKPDFLFSNEGLVVFVDGCFWHGCPICGHYPITRRSFWEAKINGNIARDKEVDRFLTRQGYIVLRIWEHSLKTKEGRLETVARIKHYLAITT